MAEARALTVGIDASRATIAQKTGTERYSARILEAVLALGTRHRFRLYLNARQPLPLALRAGDRQRLIPFPRLWTHARLSAELAGHPPDALFVPAHVVPLVHPRASVVTIHDLGYLYEPEAHPVARRLALDLTTRWSARAAARVIAISGATRDDLVRRYGVPAEKITVIHHGVDGAFQPPAEAEVARVRERYQLPARYLLSVGTLQPRKNLARLIAAFERLAAEDEKLGLVLVGKTGWLAGTIEAALTASPARARITLTGHVPDADLPALYGGAAAFAFPSLYEGFGMPALEAMACGTPVLVSDRGSLPEIVGPAAEVVDPLDVAAIAHGLERALDPATRARRIAAGRQRAAGFTWERAGAQTLATIEQAVEESRR